MMWEENMLAGSCYIYMQYTYFLLSSQHSALLYQVKVKGNVQQERLSQITARDWEGTGEEEAKCEKIEIEGKVLG